MDFLAVAMTAPLAVVLGFASLVPYAKMELISSDLKTHWVMYVLVPFLAACLVPNVGLPVQVMVLCLTLGALIDRSWRRPFELHRQQRHCPGFVQ